VQFRELDKLSGDRAEALQTGMFGYVQRVAGVIEAGQRDGLFFSGRPVTHALLIVGMCNSTTEWYDPERGGDSVEELADHAARLAISGLNRTLE
jgi:hypothetical protein